MTVATQLPLTLTSYMNQSLFSDHYLDDILRADEAWRQAIPEAQAFLAWLRDLYAAEKGQLADYNESQLEDKWFKPIFERLGHTWEGQASIPGWQGNIKKPDFVFFPDDATRKTAVSQQNSRDYANAALAIGEVKQWGIPLDKNQRGAAIFDNKNPMYQIDSYLSLTGVEWGILSNGRFWRLLHKSSSRTLETYVEIDLLAMLEAADETKATAIAIYFWLFFNQASYKPDAHGRIFLNDAQKQSRDYALELEAGLRDNAYRALEQLILGFFAANPSLNTDNPDHLADVYRNSLYLLYRLLFLFYGESRALLPMDNSTYKDEYSLQRLSKKIDRWRHELDSLPATGRIYWCELSELFRLIGGADVQLNADLDVPRYNGGLFDGQQHPFLEKHAVGDRYIAQAIDYLAVRRVMDSGGKPAYHAVDYRTLDVRQLGSIYEGLLEYTVAIAREEMVTVSQKGVETWVPLAKKGKAKTFGNRRQIGDLYLTTDKGERKATGSYYTPDYIVEYIVENTLSPLVAQAEARAMGDGDRFIAEILRLNVLDPAMGSGHFLVEATNYLARVLAVESQVTAPVTATSQVAVTSEPTTIADKVTGTLQVPVTADLLYWKRRVVEACIYGVDKNPMAVELAKLSLWLKTAAADKPLSFLDHHLQHGDSLIGATLDDLQSLPDNKSKSQTSDLQSSLIDASAFTRDVGLAVGGVMAIEGMLTETIEDVHAKEEIWQSLQRTHIADWRRLADVWVSSFFGNAMSREEYRALAGRLQGRDSLMSDAQAERLLNHPAVTDNDYFHWQFMFPEVFFDKYGRPQKEAAGFDVVIGNPPYGIMSNIDVFSRFSGLPNDFFVYFMEVGLGLSRQGGMFSYITPSAWLTGVNFQILRKNLLNKTQIKQIIGLPYDVFKDAYIDTCITACLVGDSTLDDVSTYQMDKKQDGRAIYHLELDKINPIYWIEDEYNKFILSSSVIELVRLKNSDRFVKLGDFVRVERGVQPYSRAKHSDEEIRKDFLRTTTPPSPEEPFMPELLGEELSRYSLMPKKKRWLEFSNRLAGSRDRKLFTSQRVVLRRLLTRRRELQAAVTSDSLITTDSILNMLMTGVYDPYFIACLLNSKLLAWLYTNTSAISVISVKDDFPQVTYEELNSLPVPKLSISQPNTKQKFSTTSRALYQQADHPALLDLVAAELAAGRNDTIHDLLAFLAEEMIRLNKAKQTEVNGFLDWLADYTELPLNDWKLKTIAAAYYEKGWKEFRRALKQNASKITVVDINGRSALNKIKSEYEASVSKLAAPLAAITATDALIDQIVYQLYGLTAAEIAIVEA